MKIMKYVTYILLSLSILFAGCSLFIKEKCDGVDVKVGEYLLIDASITDLAQYEHMEQLTFRDSVGNDLILTQTRFGIWTEGKLHSKLICSTGGGGSFYGGGSYSWEYFDTESWYILYEDGENRLYFNLSIDGERDDDGNLLLDKLYDKVSFTYNDTGGAHQDIKIDFVANDRQNSISPDVLSQPGFVHLDQVEINGQNYQDVWTYYINNPYEAYTILYVKQGVGILAFTDRKGTLWNIVI